MPSIISGSADTGGSLALLPLQAQATFRGMTVVINGRDDFTLENYRRVSEGGEPVAIGPRAREAMAAARADFIRLLESDRTQFIYGVTSSLGPHAKVTIPHCYEEDLTARRGRRPRAAFRKPFSAESGVTAPAC